MLPFLRSQWSENPWHRSYIHLMIQSSPDQGLACVFLGFWFWLPAPCKQNTERANKSDLHPKFGASNIGLMSFCHFCGSNLCFPPFALTTLYVIPWLDTPFVREWTHCKHKFHRLGSSQIWFCVKFFLSQKDRLDFDVFTFVIIAAFFKTFGCIWV